MTKRVTDRNGYFYIAKNPIAKAGVFAYSGRSIGAPDPNRMYQVYRPAEELSHPDAMDSFRLTPLVDDHTMLGDDADGYTPAEQKGVHGVTGSNVVFEGDTLYSDLKVFSKSFANRNKAGKRELSCGYRCRYEFTPGVFNGQAYDAIQRSPRGNHVALVDKGRMGSEVAVLDHYAFDAIEIEGPMFDREQLQTACDALEAAGAAAVTPETLEKILAAAQAITSVIQGADPASGENDPELEPGEEKPPEKPAEDAEEEETPMADETAPAATQVALDEALALVATLTAQVADLTARPTVDAADVMRQTAERDALAGRLKPHVGAFDHAAMTLDAVAKYGMDKLELKAPEGHEVTALDAYLTAKPDPTVSVPGHGLDSAPRKTGGIVANFLKPVVSA